MSKLYDIGFKRYKGNTKSQFVTNVWGLDTEFPTKNETVKTT